jgi:MFS family permease
MATALAADDVLPPADSLRALDLLNFFLAALQSGFGPFIAVYLTGQGWTPADIGFVLTAGGLAGLLTQIPAGEILDIVRSKLALVAAGSVAVASGALLFGLRPDFVSVFAASVLQGSVGGLLGLGVTAISLGLVGHDALGERLGRNQRFASIGGLIATAAVGITGYLFSVRDIFFVTAAFALPVLVALGQIDATAIHFGRSVGAPDHHHPAPPPRVRRASLATNKNIMIFGGCLFLFQLANASMLPLVGETLAHARAPQSPLILATLIVVPQIIVAMAAPWVGRTANHWGRRPLLLIGLSVVPVRALLFALTASPTLLIIIQTLDGVSGATLGVLTALTIADLTKGTGRFNLVQGLTGALSGIGASLSTSLSGIAVGEFGGPAGFVGVAAVSLSAVVLLWALMPETKPT